MVVHKAGQESSAHFRQTETSIEEYKVKEIIKVIPTLKLGSFLVFSLREIHFS